VLVGIMRLSSTPCQGRPESMEVSTSTCYVPAMTDLAPRLLPPRTPDPRTAPSLGWGIMGPGSIAERFVQSLKEHTNQRLAAVGSRSTARGVDFAQRHGVAASHGSYDELVDDPGVDIVYVATPNHHHFDGAMLALRAGKHVLVEKSFAENAQQAKEMVEQAEKSGLFIMEGMWPRFLPFMDSVRRAVEEGLIGEPISLQADLGDYNEFDPDSNMYSRALGGGTTLDRGVYVTALASFFMGRPESVYAVGIQAPSNVDAQVSITLDNGKAGYAQLLATMYAHTPANAYLAGTKGSLSFSPPWYLSPEVSILDSRGKVLDTIDSDLRTDVDALCYEACEAARVISAGGTSSPLMPARESLEISQTLDEILRQVNESWTDHPAGPIDQDTR
jgi:predicted dehydrogenase